MKKKSKEEEEVRGGASAMDLIEEKLVREQEMQENGHINEAREYVSAIVTQFHAEDKEGKRSHISARNERGILSALTMNDFLEKFFGFRNRVYDKLVNEKLIKAGSVNGRSTKNLIAFAEALQMKMERGEDGERGGITSIIRR